MSVVQERLFGLPQTELTSDDYYTPAWVFERMGLTFDLDVCAPPGGGPFVPCDRYFTQEDDGLVQPWTGRVWMNPPFSGCAAWVSRFIEHANGVALVQVSKSRHSAALWAAADALTFVGGFPFYDPTAGGEGQVFMPCWFAAFGEECVDAISRLGRVRV